jgi:hypothetical protein
VNALIFINGADVTDSCLLSATRITADSSKRITTASITIMGQAASRIARYDSAHYDQDGYSLDLRELYLVTILDGRDGVTKLFEGRIFSFNLVQSDASTFGVFYQCELNDYAAWLDRSVCWQSVALAMPASDQQIIQTLLGAFCTQINASDVVALVPVIQKYDYKTKTCRQVLDDMRGLSGGEWHVDFNGALHYGPASAAPLAPFALSTSPDMVTSFPVNVSGYRHDFNNPVNRAYVRGSVDAASGVAVEASYSDPISVGKYGEYAYSVVDPQILTGWDASLRAKSIVLQYAYPVESGTFTIWARDGLALGQQVHIVEENLGIDGAYIIRQLTMQWIDKNAVQYTAQFGAARPDLESVLRLMQQRSLWASAMGSTSTSVPAPGSVTDASIAAGGLSAGSINSVNANTIMGPITAGQISSVNAGAILGQVNAGQISTVNAGAIQGSITAGQIGSVSAGTIQGVIVSDQLANGIIDDLAKYADALRPVPMVQDSAHLPTLPDDNFPPTSFFYYVPDGHFYQINAAGTGWAINDSPQNARMSFYHIGAINSQSIIGLIVAAQIQSITAGQITGQISAGQIQSVNASSINGSITAGQISTVNASAIQGTITADKIATITAGQITGSIQSTQIGSINAATITIGLIGDGQIGSVSGAKLIVGTVQSDKLDTYSINVGGGGSKPGRVNVYDGTGVLVAQVGIVDSGGVYGGWFKVLGVGGTGWSDCKLKADTSGNLSITDAAISITNASTSSSLTTSPTTFDSTYSSITLNIAGGSDKAQMVSRGLVLNYASAKIASFVRAPSGGYAQVELAASGKPYMLLDGGTGTVRADGGFKIGGNLIIDSSGKFFPTNGLDTTGGINANAGYLVGGSLVINTSKQFCGQGVNTPSYGVACSGVNATVGTTLNGVPSGNYTGKTYKLHLQVFISGTWYTVVAVPSPGYPNAYDGIYVTGGVISGLSGYDAA